MSTGGMKITPQARHRRERESLQDQLLRNKAQISELLEVNRELDWAIKLHDECEVQGIVMGDQSDIEFHLRND